MAVLAAERVERPASLFGLAPEAPVGVSRARGSERDGRLGGGPTLDDAIAGAWEGLAARAAVACPLCGGALRPRASAAAAGAVAGRCGDCGTTLS